MSKFRLDQYFELDRFVYQLDGNKMQNINRADTDSSLIKVLVFLYLSYKVEQCLYSRMSVCPCKDPSNF